MSRSVVAAMTAYTLELREAEIKLNQNESPFDFPRELKQQVLARMAERPWNLYPDFESTFLRTAIAKAYDLTPENILVGNGSNELLAAAIGAFVGPGTPVIFPRPTFALYEKLVTIAGGLPIPIEFDPDSGLLPLEMMLAAIRKYDNALVIVCSPNNPTGGTLPEGGLDALVDSGAMVLFDQAYADFECHPDRERSEEEGSPSRLPGDPSPSEPALSDSDPERSEGEEESNRRLLMTPLIRREIPRPAKRGEGAALRLRSRQASRRVRGVSPPRTIGARGVNQLGMTRPNLVTFRTFSKAWGLAALRVGWLASTAENCREIRKVKLPYSLNVISEAIAALALENPAIRDRNVARIVAERERLLAELRSNPRITVFPTRANFITFRTQKPLFEALCARGVLVRDVSGYPRLAGCLRVSIGAREQNDAFLAALKEVV